MVNHRSIITILSIVLVCSAVHAHVYRSGALCTRPDPVVDFDMNRFLGRWYVLQKTRMNVNCLVYNITRVPPEIAGQGDKTSPLSSSYRIEQISYFPPSTMGIHSDGSRKPHHKLTYAGRLWAPDGTTAQSHMNVQFPLNVIGESTFDIFATDYTNYAGVFSCQPFLFLHRQCATFMSRTRSLSADTIKMLRYHLYDNNINDLSMTEISQVDCGNDDDDGTAEDNIDIRAAKIEIQSDIHFPDDDIEPVVSEEPDQIKIKKDDHGTVEDDIDIRAAGTRTEKPPKIEIQSEIHFPDDDIEPVVSEETDQIVA